MRKPPSPPSTVTVATVTWTQTRLGLEIANGVGEYARSQGWNLIRLDNRAAYAVGALRRAEFDGIIVQAFDDAPVKALLAMRRPLINVSNSRRRWLMPKVVSDDFLVGRWAADFFLGKGFSAFAFCGTARSGTAILRQHGFAARLRECGHRVDVLRGDYDLPLAYGSAQRGEALRDWLAALPKPCALFAWNDSVCDTMANFCRSEGIRIPQEVSLLGVNNEFGRQLEDESQSISSIELAGHSIGYNAARVLGEWLKGAVPQQPVQVPPVRIVERRSTDFHAVADPAVRASLRFIRQNCQRSIGVEDIARAAMVSRRILEKRFRGLLQISPYAELMRCRLDRAKDFLLGTNLKLEEIAQLCGFDNGSNFSLFFRDKAGCCPSLFRARRSIVRPQASSR